MAKLQPKYAAIPDIPLSGVNPWEAQMLTSLKQNVELLAGISGEKDKASKAVLRAQITIGEPPVQVMQSVTATGSGYTINAVRVPSLEDYSTLIGNVQTLASDVAVLRSVVNTLIQQLKG